MADRKKKTTKPVPKPEAPVRMDQINPTAMPAYTQQGPGVGGNETAVQMMTEMTSVKLDPTHKILDVGFGAGGVIVNGVRVGCEFVAGVDAAAASIEHLKRPDMIGEEESWRHFVQLVQMDVSHERLPFDDDTFDIVFCTETIEHLSNPYFAVVEIKRVLKHDGLFVLAFPMPENNLGYGGGEHMHTYPFFLMRASFEMFMKNLYFRAPVRRENGASAWYCYRNAKEGGPIVDLFHVIAGNYDERELYGWLD